jgi:ABC-type polysaccharide/polyol phosphate export permease
MNQITRNFKSFIDEIIQYRYLIFQIGKQSIIEKYRRSFLSFLWIFLIPFGQTIVFVVLKRMSIIPQQDDAALPYALYVFHGLIYWKLFSSILVLSSQTLTTRYRALTSISFPREILIYGTVVPVLLNTVILLLLFMFGALWFGFIPSRETVLVGVIVALIILLAMGLGKICAIVNVLTRDISMALPGILICWLIATPAIYNQPGKYAPFFDYINPVNVLISLSQKMLAGTFLNAGQVLSLLGMICVCIFIFSLGTYFFRRTIVLIIERL